MKRAAALVVAGDLAPELAIARPRCRAECARGPRPCPWFGCVWHLGLSQPRRTRHRPGVLRSTATGETLRGNADWRTVERFIADVVETLPTLAASCVLDVADAGAIGPTAIARMMGIPKQHVVATLRSARTKLKLWPALREVRRGA